MKSAAPGVGRERVGELPGAVDGVFPNQRDMSQLIRESLDELKAVTAGK